MKHFVAAGLLIFAIGCASTDDVDAPSPVTVPQAAAPDPRVGELQTALTELLERLDVMNSRLARLEEGGVTTTGATGSQPVETQPVEEPRRAESPSSQEPAEPPVQRALIGAKLAEDYRQAIMLFGRGRHADARAAFQQVFDADTTGDLADNALFWIG
jgi:TolA-binding protein